MGSDPIEDDPIEDHKRTFSANSLHIVLQHYQVFTHLDELINHGSYQNKASILRLQTTGNQFAQKLFHACNQHIIHQAALLATIKQHTLCIRIIPLEQGGAK